MEDIVYDFLKVFIILSFVMGVLGFFYVILTGDARGLVSVAWACFLFYALTRRG